MPPSVTTSVSTSTKYAAVNVSRIAQPITRINSEGSPAPGEAFNEAISENVDQLQNELGPADVPAIDPATVADPTAAAPPVPTDSWWARHSQHLLIAGLAALGGFGVAALVKRARR
jgi:hypothetical protein